MMEDDRDRLSTSDIASAADHSNDQYPDSMDTQGQHPDSMGTQAQPNQSGAVAVQGQGQSRPTALFPSDEAQSLRSHWDQVQGSFVDDPQKAVQQADSLVAEVIKRLADSFAEERSKLEQQWSAGENVSTEDLRVALQKYRSFFDRLLSL